MSTPQSIRWLVPLGALALWACGPFGGDAARSDTTEGPAEAVVLDGPEQGGGAAPTPLAPAADSGSPEVEADATSPAPDAELTGPLAAQAPSSQQALSVEERLDRLLESQEALNRRLDSLAIAQAPADSARGLADSGEVFGEAGERVRSFGVGIIWSIIVIALFNLTIRGFVWVLDALAERNVRRRLFYKRLVPIVRIVLWVFAAYLIVSVIFQVDAQGLLAAAAAVGVAVGFAAQDLLKNLFGGLILVFDQPFQVGDKIRVGGTYGEVKSIGLRSTRIVTPDDNLVSVPNAQVVDQQVANANAGELNCQVVTDLYLPGWADEELAKRIAFEAAASSKYVYLNKPIVILIADEFKETFLTRIRVKAYVLDPRLEFQFQSDVTERARAGFREAGLLQPQHMKLRLVERSAVGFGGSVPTPADPHAGE
ncbi:MAG TPA: mechanosensitive ion channel family protein [Longimicrobiales bacterium]|nr:mechanosensitive ion channel family protein [Longimicrobiales bacterium]